MANYLKLGQGLMRHLPQAKGSSSTVKLGKEGIEALAKKNPELGKVIAEFTEGIKNPTLEIAQKAQGNYAIAGFRIRSGETVLGKGAYSTSQGAKGIVEKMHVEKGDIITTITKEGELVVSKNVSKKDLARAAQEKAKASEFMTKEVKGLNGERILVRKLKNGNTVETTTRKDGSVCTKVTLPDGNWYTRVKYYTETPLGLEEAKFLEQKPTMFDFRRVDKHVIMNSKANLYKDSVRMPKQGRIYATDLRTMDDKLVAKYKGLARIPKEGTDAYKLSILDPKQNKFIDKEFRHGSWELNQILGEQTGWPYKPVH